MLGEIWSILLKDEQTGDVFNLAARLLDIAREPGVIAIDARTMETVRGEFECTTLGQFKLKGKPAPVPVWGICRRTSSESRQSKAVRALAPVRNEEWLKLKHGVNECVSGQHDRFLAFVEGASGMGKSSLLEQIQHEFRSKVDDICPYSVLKAVVARLFELVMMKITQADPVTLGKIETAIVAKTGGNFLQMDLLVSHVANRGFDMTDRSNDASDAFERILSATIEHVVIAQLDRVDPSFQSILKVSSVLGQYFTLGDISFLLDGRSTDSIAEVIRTKDIFEFLKYDEEGEESLYFRHIAIRTAVYESLSLTERQRLHWKIAQRLEKILAEQEQKDLAVMSTMCHHYWESADFERMIKCNAELGCRLADNGLDIEAKEVLTKVFDFVEAYRQNGLLGGMKTRIKVKQFFSKDEEATALARLAAASRHLAPELSKEYAIRSLELMGVKWPKNPGKTRRAIFKALFDLGMLWIQTSGGMRDKKDTHSITWKYSVGYSLSTLGTLAMYFPGFTKEEALLCRLWFFNHTLKNCKTVPRAWFLTVVVTSYSSLQVAPWMVPVSKSLARKARTIQRTCTDITRSDLFIYTSVLFAVLNEVEESLELGLDCLRFWEKADPYGIDRFKTQILIFLPRLLYGVIGETIGYVTLPLLEKHGSVDPLWGLYMLEVLKVEAFYLGRLEPLKLFSQMASQISDNIPQRTRFVFAHIPGLGQLMQKVVEPNCKQDEIFQALAYVLDQAMPVLFEENPIFAVMFGLATFVGFCKLRAIAASKFSQFQRTEISGKFQAVWKAIENRKSTLWPMTIARHLLRSSYASSALALEPKSSAGTREQRRCIKFFQEMFNRKPFCHKMVQGSCYFFFGAAFNGMLSYLETSAEVKMRHSMHAKQMFASMKTPLLEQWAEGF
ncbi:hypothetical protein HDU96_002212 [Phlyctochytrium bullatum]|nr:hypothetical protein HDU96_002212 [Phlyctochytrium bullatum]